MSPDIAFPLFRFRIMLNGRLQPVQVHLPGVPDVGEMIELDGRPCRVTRVELDGHRGVLELREELAS